jgi:hypothetical protein
MGEVVPVLNHVLRHGVSTPRIPNLHTILRWMIASRPNRYILGPLAIRLGGSKSRSNNDGEEKKFVPAENRAQIL